MLVGTRWSRASTTARTRRATTPLATTMSTEHDKRFHSSHFKITNWVTIKFNHWDSIDFDHQEGNSLTGVRGSYTGAAGNTIHYVADQWGFRLVWRKYQEWKQTKRFFCVIFPSPRDASSVAVFVVRYPLMYYTQFRDGHADADRLPIRKMLRHYRAISDICRMFRISALMRMAKNIRMTILNTVY